MFVQNINTSAEWFPCTSAILNDFDFKYAFLNTMPEKWKQEFSMANMHVTDMDITKSATYFLNLEFAVDQLRAQESAPTAHNNNFNNNRNNRRCRRDGGDDEEGKTIVEFGTITKVYGRQKQVFRRSRP